MSKEKTPPEDMAEIKKIILSIKKEDLCLGKEEEMAIRSLDLFKRMADNLDPAHLLDAMNLFNNVLYDLSEPGFRQKMGSLLSQKEEARRFANIFFHIWGQIPKSKQGESKLA